MDIFIKRRFSLKIEPKCIWSFGIPAFFILTFAFFSSACSREKGQGEQNVILITLDTQRADFISAYGNNKASTPHIDSLAEEGILYKNCYSLIPITLPAHASLFYSQPPHKLKLYNNGQVFQKRKKMASLAEIFQKHGFKTKAFVSLGVLRSKYGLDDGFENYEESFYPQRWYLHAHEVNEKAIPWIKANKDSAFFLWIHYSDPHDPYAPPTIPDDLRVSFNGNPMKDLCIQKFERITLKFALKKGENTIGFQVLNHFPDSRDDFRIRFNGIEFLNSENLGMNFKNLTFYEKEGEKYALLKKEAVIKVFSPDDKQELILNATGEVNLLPSEKRGFYKQEVEYMDGQIGILFKKIRELNLLNNTTVVIAGDHGEGLGEDSTPLGGLFFGHIHFLYERYMKVPLIILSPSLKEKGKGKKIEQQTTIMDITPTLMALMGWKKMPFHEGRNLLKIRKDPDYVIFEATYRPEAVQDKFAVFRFPWNMILTPEKQHYELYNLQEDAEEKKNIYKKTFLPEELQDLKQKLDAFSRDALKGKKEIRIDKDTEEMLRALGYIR